MVEVTERMKIKTSKCSAESNKKGSNSCASLIPIPIPIEHPTWTIQADGTLQRSANSL